MTPKSQLSLPEQIAFQAEFIVNNLQQTDYQHTDKIDVDAGIYDCDCNGFAALVLGRSAPDHFALIPKETEQPRPRAFEYYDFFASQTPESTEGWHRIDFLRDVRRGDLVAWRFPVIEKGHDTGHVLIAAERAAVMDSGNFSLRVYDSANTPHFEDTREEGETGVGSGFINFTVDADGRPTAFQFSPTDEYVRLAIAIGRVETMG